MKTPSWPDESLNIYLGIIRSHGGGLGRGLNLHIKIKHGAKSQDKCNLIVHVNQTELISLQILMEIHKDDGPS